MNQLGPSVQTPSAEPVTSHPEAAPQKLSALTSLLENLDEAPQQQPSQRNQAEFSHQNKLVQVRLGVASALFTTLRAKHAPTAAHSLRVALGCSSWTLKMDVSEEQRDEIEVAALLHDIGKVGVPDYILRKPGKLTRDEAALVEQHRKSGIEIIASCSASREILDAVFYSSCWFDGSRKGFDRWAERLPLGARMISLVDAFDSMTTDHVYRRALSRERAMSELYRCAGTQFDPRLVEEFCNLLSTDRVKFNAGVARRWLQELHPASSNALWCLNRLSDDQQNISVDGLFQQKLVDSMHDAVIFVDASRKIMLWNRAAERITGVPASAVLQKGWSPGLVEMRDEDSREIDEADCPIAYCVKQSVQTMRRLSIRDRNKQHVAVDAHLVPVVGRDGVCHGATLLLHDASSQITLEERVETLHVKATQDPLTGVSNRAEFDRMHDHFVDTHTEAGMPFSLIICDLDLFKRINDNYGHQAGDEALMCFAGLLRRFRRGGDVVARYGGEEFVMLCADCDNQTATSRAEELRRELELLPQPSLSGKSITASFGVTQLQAGDTSETMLRRADRALLQAKDLGRNTVVQLGSGIGDEEATKKRGWFSWFQSAPAEKLLQRSLITTVPLKVVVEKLRGFVADHHAEITSIEADHLVLKIEGHDTGMLRRRNDRSVPFLFELRFEEVQLDVEGTSGTALRTLIHVIIRPIRSRDRRRRNVVDRARQLVVSLKSYLMAQDFSDNQHTARSGDDDEEEVTKEDGVVSKAKTLFGLK